MKSMKFLLTITRRRYEQVLGALVGILGIVIEVYISTTNWWDKGSSAVNNPAYFPDLVGKGLILMAIIMIASAFRVKKQETVTLNLAGIVMVVLWFIFGLTLQYTGIIIGGAIAIFLSLLMWGERRPLHLALISILSPIVIYVILGVMMKVKFPLGILKNIL